MSLRQFFNRILPHRHEFQKHKHLQWLGDILHDPNIFHLTRHSVAGGVAVGLFLAFLPIPGQMIVAALIAIYLRVNLPLAVILVWLSNPVTIPPLLFMAYRTGALILNQPTFDIQFEFSFMWIEEVLADVWPAVLLGCLTFGIIASITGYAVIRLLWRMAIVRKWEERKKIKRRK